MKLRRSILIYCQHLSGTGHFVRSYEIARALTESCDVWLLDGGRPVPRPVASDALRLVSLPRIVRVDGALKPLRSTADIADVMHRRLRQLRDVVRKVRPDVLIVEHFPFSKWELESEIMATASACRDVRPDCLIVNSLRDIVVQSRFDPGSDEHAARTLSILDAVFDGVLVHADQEFTQLDAHLPWAGRLPVPMAYTGFVSEKPSRERCRIDKPLRGPGPVIVSGGGADDGSLIERCLDAWNLLVTSGEAGAREMIVFLPPFTESDLNRRLTSQAARVGAQVRPFGVNFLSWLNRADLSISQAGYNTCTNLLQTRTRAILVPNERMSDQALRAQAFLERNLAVRLSLDECSPAVLANAMRTSLEKPEPQHKVDLEGAHGTWRILKEWLAADGPRDRTENCVPLARPAEINP